MDRKTIQPIENGLLSGIVSRCQETFQCLAVYGNTKDRIRVVERMRSGKKVEYPYLYLRIASVNENPEGFKSHLLSRYGLIAYVEDAENVAQRVRLIPTNFVIEATYVTNAFNDTDQKSVLEFSRRWMFARRNGYLKFNIKYGNMLNIRIGVTMDESVSIPDMENKTETASEVEVTAQFTMHGYVSEPYLNPVGIIQKVDISQQITTNPNAIEFWPF